MVGLWWWASGAAAQPKSPQAGWGGYVDAPAEAWSNGTPVLDLDGRWAKGYVARAGEQRAYVTARAEALPAMSMLNSWSRKTVKPSFRLSWNQSRQVMRLPVQL